MYWVAAAAAAAVVEEEEEEEEEEEKEEDYRALVGGWKAYSTVANVRRI